MSSELATYLKLKYGNPPSFLYVEDYVNFMQELPHDFLVEYGYKYQHEGQWMLRTYWGISHYYENFEVFLKDLFNNLASYELRTSATQTLSA